MIDHRVHYLHVCQPIHNANICSVSDSGFSPYEDKCRVLGILQVMFVHKSLGIIRDKLKYIVSMGNKEESLII